MSIAKIEGRIHYRTREGLPPCTLTVELYNASLADHPNPVIASTSRLIPHGGSLTYTLVYDTDCLEAGHDYALGAAIYVQDRLYKYNTTHHAISLPGTTEQDILVEFVGNPPGAQAPEYLIQPPRGFRIESSKGIHGGNLGEGLHGGNLIEEPRP
ncbi:YbaY family lipoprotein [Pseudomonas massiliensis]|uniref:YbaY family lipoprotein n=1 Tax=Pseudomonas massiliensis TaxID=522492 RepID=UPI00058E6D72|nr:YbaY family lipoprotein [Pseudomonas massiliensis]